MKTVTKPFIAIVVALSFVIGSSFVGPISAQEASVVLDIVVRGNDQVDETVILDVLEHIEVGEPLDVDGANEDLFRIYEMGYFFDVVAEIESLVGIRNGVRFVIEVFEFPVLRDISI